MAFSFGARSEANLVGVHPDLVRVVRRALDITLHDFAVIEGVRTLARQRELVASKASKTMASRHLATQCPAGVVGHAVDLYPTGRPTPWEKCKVIKLAMFAASSELRIPIRWGGDWDMDGRSDDETFYDGPHFELLRRVYP